mmetsp:Transcript_10602/g.20465  ORF Transcript_10602/g.20465 Transcript_10602/m.20465 type:complete len:254 (+) Transcript_10602:251-1012(+)
MWMKSAVACCCGLMLEINAAWTNPLRIAHHSNASNSRDTGPLVVSEHYLASPIDRKTILKKILSVSVGLTAAQSNWSRPAYAYTPDSDKLRESLYLISRVQEATVQQERFVHRANKQEELKSKMKLTLRLVEKNYRLLDQIIFASNYITNQDVMVEVTGAGYEAAEALQNAIDYVNADLRHGPFEKGQKEYLTSNLRECREKLFLFLDKMPQTKLAEARNRVEEENVLNRDEFDGDADAGVYSPVVLPWKNRN